MAIDYEELAQTAAELVEEAGRAVTFIQYNDTPANASEPWKGPTDPRASVVQSHALSAVAVDVGTAKSLGMASIPEDLLKRTSQFFIVAPGPDFTGDLRLAHEVIDEASRWAVVHVDTLRPGPLVLLYYVAVGQ